MDKKYTAQVVLGFVSLFPCFWYIFNFDTSNWKQKFRWVLGPFVCDFWCSFFQNFRSQ